MHAPKIEWRAHTYQYTTEIKIQVINKQSKDTMVQLSLDNAHINYIVIKNFFPGPF